VVLNQRNAWGRLALGGGVALAFALALGGAAHGQILPTTTTTTTSAPPELTTTTVVPTTSSTASTTTRPSTTTTATAHTTTTRPGPTTTTFVPPSGVSRTTLAPAASTEPLDPKLGMLPLFVGLSLGGFAVAVAIVTVQWIRTRGGLR
jgi:hypothetical protein